MGGGALLCACSVPPVRQAFPTLHPANISADRVIRVVVGLRPYRAQGFVVRAEALGDKLVVHNYGHGGGGITLCWGTAELAFELGFRGAGRRYAVIGCGAVGLATATLLQRHGGQVTIYAKALPPETTSNIAGGHWSPYSVFNAADASPAFLEQFHRAVRLAYRHFQALPASRYGISWRRNYAVSEKPTGIDAFVASIRDVVPGIENLKPGEHPFGDRYVQTSLAMMVETTQYLAASMDAFLLAGGRIEVRDFPDRASIAALPEAVVFNCTGLGAKALFGDEGLEPARGQLVVVVPQPEVDYNLFAYPYHVFPRSDGIVLGGTFERGVWDLQPNAETTARILQGTAQAMATLRGRDA
jgi:glycine/D-amino acid oxidase-like deaminating enzyme